MSLWTRAKKAIRPDKELFKEGDKLAHIILDGLSDKEMKRRYMGVDPKQVPREAQLELYNRFVQPHALRTCSQCHGRGWTDWIVDLHQLAPCQCLQRVIRDEVGKENKIILLSN